MDIFEVIKAGDEEQLNLFFSAVKESEENQYVINSKNIDKYTPLHYAIFARNLKAVELLIENDADINAKCFGTPPSLLALYTATLPHGKDFGLQVFQKIIQHSQVNPFAKDDNGFSALHIAAKYNFTDAIQELFKIAEANDLVNSITKSGMTPLHLTAVTDAVESAKILVESGANYKKRIYFNGMTAVHLAAQYSALKVLHYLIDNKYGSLDEKDATGLTAESILRLNGFPSFSSSSSVTSIEDHSRPLTGIYTSSHCFNHHTCNANAFENADQPPENVHRLEVLLDPSNGILYSQEFQGKLLYQLENPLAPIGDVVRVHEWSYIQNVQKACRELSEDYNDEDEGIGKLDGDTTISRGTYHAAFAAAGAVCAAVDRVMKKEIRNAFCPIRPPGHHAGPRGAIGEGSSMSHGFCIFNNVSIGASYVMNQYRETVKKVVIVDFDVHHGNGTEETVRWLKPGVDKVTISCELVTGTLVAPRYKPWFSEKDAEHVLFISVHGYGPRARGYEHLFPLAAFYPGSGSTKIPEIPVESPSNSSKSSVDPLILDIGVPLPRATHQPIQTKESKAIEELEVRINWRNYFREEIFPRIVQFAPDFMIISAGFDAHKKDAINAGYISIVEEDFGWITDHLSYIANSCCDGRIVSALEGGYQISGEYSSSFSKSVQSHVHSLVRAAISSRRYDDQYNQIEQENEIKYLNKLKQLQEKEIEKEQERILRQQQHFQQLQLQRQQQQEEAEAEGQSEGKGINPLDVPVGAETVVNQQNQMEVTTPTTEEGGTGRKRKRAVVDYVALDQELRKAQVGVKDDSNVNQSSSNT